MKRSRKFVYIGQIAGSMILGSLGAVVLSVAAGDGMPELSYLFMGCLFYGPFLCYPFFLTAYEGYLLVSRMCRRTRQEPAGSDPLRTPDSEKEVEEAVVEPDQPAESEEVAVTRQSDPLFYDFYVMLLAFFMSCFIFFGEKASHFVQTGRSS